MQQHLIKSGDTFNTPKRMLLSGMAIKDGVFFTPLLAWYAKSGLIISDVRLVIEYCAARPFTKFIAHVSKIRREASQNPSQTMMADLYKLMQVGNLKKAIIKKMLKKKKKK